MTNKVRVAIGVEVIGESLRGAVADAALVWENTYVDTIRISDNLSTAPNVGDMFGDIRCHPVRTLLPVGHHDDLSGQHARQCFAAHIGRAA